MRDAWARMTPYEMGVPGREYAERTFPRIREEAEGRGVDLRDPGAFLLLGEVGRALRALQGEERGGEAIHRYGAFLFHAFHFHREGEPLVLVSTEAARYVVEGSPELPGWDGEVPGEAGYLQLPRNLFWSDPSEEGAAEPVDGIFWTRSAGGSLSLLVAMGLRDDRPGISVVELPPVPLAQGRRWIGASAREQDFATTLPGGEMDRLYSVVTIGEVLKLAGRLLGYAATVPDALGEEERAPHPRDLQREPGGPRPTFLPYRRLRLIGDGGRGGGPGRPEGEPGAGGGSGTV